MEEPELWLWLLESSSREDDEPELPELPDESLELLSRSPRPSLKSLRL